ncbi:hypothetical protein NLJ89_g10739 [Agrocybe chaxingu]|uniref:NACHT domain-containing protein n=1 Tax=Agrocybe chaxingu TaxID=84603 RepID=A0A9W8MNM5_9AGAR|nr:hypothetical protein NLJ89_g10739 [Agrocybe chaxingu]
MFNNARHVHIENSAINFATQSHGKLGLQLLLQKTAAGATHDSAQLESHAPCHPMTRKTVLRRIMDWANTTEHQSDILWLRGPAGAGKTSILKTICSSCHEAGVLGGSFFFQRNVQQLNSPRCLVTTLAYQLAIAFPELGDWINEVVGQDPSILDKTIEQQLQKLVIDPALATDFARSHRRVVFVIDGLDECVSEKPQCQIIRLINSIFKHHRAPFCFIIASRPEPWIRDEFETDVFKHNLQQVSLEQSNDTDQDIRTFLTQEFVDMCESPRHAYSMSDITKPWPPPKDINVLVHRASGQFIYAVTVLRFVDDPNYHPPDRLRLVLDIPLTTAQLNPLAELDKLYMQIMGTCVDKKRTLDVLATLLTMLTLRQTSTLVTPFVWFPRLELLDVAGCLLGLGPNEAYRALRMIHSLVKISPLSNEEREKASFNAGYWHETINRPDAIAFHHKSFPDFLLDSRRSGCCFVDIDSAHRSTGLACLDIMKGLSSKQPSRINYGQKFQYLSLRHFAHISIQRHGVMHFSIGIATSVLRVPPQKRLYVGYENLNGVTTC